MAPRRESVVSVCSVVFDLELPTSRSRRSVSAQRRRPATFSCATDKEEPCSPRVEDVEPGGVERLPVRALEHPLKLLHFLRGEREKPSVL